MAASLLQSKPRLNDASLPRSALQVPNNQNVLRAKELFAVGDNVNARREWYRTLSTQPDEEKINFDNSIKAVQELFNAAKKIDPVLK